MDAFSPPHSDSEPTQVGTVDAVDAVSVAFSALFENLLSTVVLVVGMFSVYFVSICTCVGWFVTLPMLMWGFYYWSLHAVTGPASASLALEPVSQDPVRVFLKGWGYMVCIMVISLPASVVGAGSSLLGDFLNLNAIQTMAMTLGATLIGLVYMAIMSRFNLALFYMVDSDIGVIECLNASWSENRRNWVQLAIMTAAMALFMLPGNLVVQLANIQLQQAIEADPLTVFSVAPMFYGVLFVVSMVNAAIALIYGLSCAAAYRQVHPLSEAA